MMTDGEARIGVEGVNPDNSDKPKGEQVEEMFDSISPVYDFMNKAMTLGMHHKWRDRALATLAKEYAPGEAPRDIIDLATGTGDVAFELHKIWPEAKITGLDLSEGMLDIARKREAELPAADREKITFRKGDCMAIDAPDGSFDVATVAYGVRNFERLADGFSEIYRILRPGGRLCVIELSVPERKLTRGAYNVYTEYVIPYVGLYMSRHHTAYSYLPKSIAAAPQRRDLALLMRQAGFRHCRWKSLTFGVVTFYLAEKPVN